jgi:DNA mismatch repair protein MutS
MAKHASPLETPMMRQYLEAKQARPDCILLMRMGDFYEAFLDDAKELSRICGVALTSRNKDDPNPIAMAGVPHHSLKTHLPKLLAAGRQVAVMDQLENPAEAKGLVKRGLTKVISAGTLIDEDALDAATPNHLVALTGLEAGGGRIGIAALDVSTGRFAVEDAGNAEELSLALARLAPAELLLPEDVRRHEATPAHLARLFGALVVPPVQSLPAYAWKPADARRHLCERLRVAALDGFGVGADDDHLCAAAAAALRYAEQAAAPAAGADATPPLAHVRSLRRTQVSRHLIIDLTCRRNLELLRNARDGTRRGSLLEAIDRTRTAPGARLLAEWLARPLAEVDPIARRQEAVAALVGTDQVRTDVRSKLAEVYDVERLLARIATGRSHGRDLVHLATSLEAAKAIGQALTLLPAVPPLLAEAVHRLNPAGDLAAEIRRVLVDAPPLAVTEGGMVRDGIDPALDELRAITRDSATWMAAFEARELARAKAETGLDRIKVGFNGIHGYFIEVAKSRAEQVPRHYVRKQTLVNHERYYTSELKEFEDKALTADERAKAIEHTIFERLRVAAEDRILELQRMAQALAETDVCAGLADLARVAGWCRPVVDDSQALDIVAGRHPVVEDAIGRSRFVPNDCALDAADDAATGRLAVITGPNMAGKSTYIRQVAVIAILAQAGAFVPAERSRLGIVDRLFTRVGAGDELGQGKSTFMVEMAETAAILHHATRRSLVILDEIGRGTSTFDGLSLAWAITEHLHDTCRCRTLFATHYHELADLAADRPGIRNRTVAVAEQDDDVAFLHRIEPGVAAKSYGIHVAQLAGVPRAVVARARAVLATLEQLNVTLEERERPKPANAPVQLTLFQLAESPTLQRLKSIDLDQLTPKQAHDLLGDLQAAAKRE